MSTSKRVIDETNGEPTTPPTSPKKQRADDKDESEKVGATELASAMALASLASFSPKTEAKGTDQGEIRTPPETRDVPHDTEVGSVTSSEPTGPGTKDPTPVTPETRFPPASREKRVSFAPGVKQNQRTEGIRRIGFSSRFSPPISRLPPGFSRGGGAFGPPRVSHHHHHHPPQTYSPPWAHRHGSMMAPPSPGGYMPPPRPMVMHPHYRHLHAHHAHHHSAMPYHAPPTPPAAAASSQWICDYCNAASFASYEEACYHEEHCRRRAVAQAYRPQPPPYLPGMQQPPPPHGHPAAAGRVVDVKSHQPRPQTAAPPASSAILHPEHIDDDRPSAEGRDWCKGTVRLAIPELDKEWLSEINCFIREECVEAFSAPEDEVKKASKRGRIGPDQVGIRCRFCKDVPLSSRTAAAVSYPTSVAGIYESVKRWQRVHMSLCEDVPKEVKDRVQELENDNAWVATTRQYWADSARALGMVDTLDGIRFGSDPSKGPDTSQLKAALSNKDKDKMKEGEKVGDGDYIVFPEDVSMVPPYVYFLMRQVESCHFTEADRFVARSKGPVGYPGFQCRHCKGHAGLGKYFPVTSKSLATNSTSQNIHAHLLKCRKTPSDIKAQLVALKEEKTRAPRLEPGWRKVFFDQVWTRLHGTEPE